MHAIILANGDLGDPDAARAQVQLGDLVVCADGGARHAMTLGVRPHAVVGDMDSLDDAVRETLEALGCELLTHPACKDETDLELALVYAVERGATEIVILGALGGRLDQTLANVLLLAHPALTGVKARIVSGNVNVLAVRGGEERVLRGTGGDTVSLLPLAGDVAGITTTGLEYALHDGTLRFALARGVSNVMTDGMARIHVGEGILLVVHTSGEHVKRDASTGHCV